MGVVELQEAYVWTPSDWFGLSQLVVGVLGLAFAGYQLWRTARATEASQHLLARRLLTNDLLILLPEVHRLEDAVERAARANDVDQTAEALLAYVHRVPNVIGHFKADDALRGEKIVKLLSQAVAAAGRAKGDLYDRPGEAPMEIVRTARQKMMNASVEIGEVTARLRKTPEVTK